MVEARAIHRGLRVLLGVLAVVVGLGGLVTLLGASWLLGLDAMRGLLSGSAIGLVLRFVGALALGLGYLLYQAARDPVRYAAVIDVFAFLLIVGAIIDVYAALTHLVGGPFLPAVIWGRAALRIAIAIVLIAWRPRAG